MLEFCNEEEFGFEDEFGDGVGVGVGVGFGGRGGALQVPELKFDPELQISQIVLLVLIHFSQYGDTQLSTVIFIILCTGVVIPVIAEFM